MLKRHQVLERVEASLASTPDASGAAYFGSMATATDDALSDIDLVVGCDNEATSILLRGLHGFLGLVLPVWSPLDYDFAGALRRFHEAAKAEARGKPPKRPIQAAEQEVRRFASSAVRPEAWQLYERSKWESARRSM